MTKKSGVIGDFGAQDSGALAQGVQKAEGVGAVRGGASGKGGKQTGLWLSRGEGSTARHKPFSELPILLYAEHCLAGSLAGAEERFFSFYREAADLAGESEFVLVMADPAKRYEKLDFFALAQRGVRGLLDAPSLFLAQLRAALRVSARERVALLLPFVTGTDEIAAARALLEEAMRELVSRREAFDELCELGAVVETPAAALCAGEIAGEVDFLLIDTDSLSSFFWASSSPEELAFSSASARDALLFLIGHAIGEAHERGRFVCLVGRLVTSEPFASRLIALGADALALPEQALLRARNWHRSRR